MSRFARLAALLGACLVPTVAAAQPPTLQPVGADAVTAFRFGRNTTFGQSPTVFPANVLGLPDPAARPTIASTDPMQICALGEGGTITLRFTRHAIIDRPGADFTVFENAFYRAFGSPPRAYAEPATVEVSRDGEHFVRFPYDPVTLSGLAGVTPVDGSGDLTNPAMSGGDAFDLATLGIDSVRFVRLTDITAKLLCSGGALSDDGAGGFTCRPTNPPHPYYDFTVNGFDLDAVVALHTVALDPTAVRADNRPTGFRLLDAAPNPFNPTTAISYQLSAISQVNLQVFDALGRQVRTLVDETQSAGLHSVPFDAVGLPSGAYLVRLTAGREIATRRVTLLR